MTAKPLTKRGLINAVCVLAVVVGILSVAAGGVVAIMTAFVDAPPTPALVAVGVGVAMVVAGVAGYQDDETETNP